MPATLKHIEVDNFKSYRGRTVIGPLKPFNAVIGPNGSGKNTNPISIIYGIKCYFLRRKIKFHGCHQFCHGRENNKFTC